MRRHAAQRRQPARGGLSLVNDGAVAGDTQLAGADLRSWPSRRRPSSAPSSRAARSDDLPRAASRDGLSRRAEARHRAARGARLLHRAAAGLRRRASSSLPRAARARPASTCAGRSIRSGRSRAAAGAAQPRDQADRQLAEAEVRYELGDGRCRVRLRHVADDVPGEGTRHSEQTFVTGNASTCSTVASACAAAPTRRSAVPAISPASTPGAHAALGVDWHVRDDVDLFTEWEHGSGAALRSDMTRVGVRAGSWGAPRSLRSTRSTEVGPRSFANFGLTQGASTSAGPSTGLDRAATSRARRRALLSIARRSPRARSGCPVARQQRRRQQQPRIRAAHGGTTARRTSRDLRGHAVPRRGLDPDQGVPNFRSADGGVRWSFTGGWYREQSRAIHRRCRCNTGQRRARRSRRGAHRPCASPGPGGQPTRAGSSSAARTSRASAATTRPRSRRRCAGSTTCTPAGSRATGRSASARLPAGDRQRSTSCGSRAPRCCCSPGTGASTCAVARLRPRALDTGLHAARIESREAGVARSSFGFDVGISPATNCWISVGYNVVGFHDADFSAARTEAPGPYVAVRIKADQDTFKDLRLDSLRAPRQRRALHAGRRSVRAEGPLALAAGLQYARHAQMQMAGRVAEALATRGTLIVGPAPGRQDLRLPGCRRCCRIHAR